MGKSVWAVLAGLCIFLYQNCSSEVKVTESLSCSPTEKASLEMVNFKPSTHCANIDFYSCEMRVFSPDVSDGELEKQECVHVAGLGHQCIQVKVRNYSTKSMLASEAPELFKQGEAYNYSEISCANQFVLHNEKSIFSSEGDSVQKALSMVVESCMETSI